MIGTFRFSRDSRGKFNFLRVHGHTVSYYPLKIDENGRTSSKGPVWTWWFKMLPQNFLFIEMAGDNSKCGDYVQR
jgi:hypothetical protein